MRTDMNNQYKQLAIQAGMYVDLNSNPYPKAMSAEESEAAYKKFADLIVEECVNVLQTRSQQAVIVNAVKEIKEHFGVTQ